MRTIFAQLRAGTGNCFINVTTLLKKCRGKRLYRWFREKCTCGFNTVKSLQYCMFWNVIVAIVIRSLLIIIMYVKSFRF